ncbi:MAG TPA: type 1 glutamine amidotransferase domain-containing protein [Acetobacteraceae bacterium]
MSKKVLFVVTSTARMGEGGPPTGLWLEELAVPYYMLRDAGHQLDVVSIAGGTVPIDPRSVGPEHDRLPENRRYRDDPALMATMQSTRSVSAIRFADYHAVFLPGGHGTMWDLPGNEALASGISAMFASGKPVAAVCHGPAGLIGARLPDGRPLVAGRWIPAFTAEEEDDVEMKDKVPFVLDEKLGSLGARLLKGAPFQPMAVAHGHLITGQNPASAREVGGLMLAALQRDD